MVLHLLPRPESVLAEFKRVTRPGGMVICCNEDGNMQSNWPPNPELQHRIDLALAQIIDLHMGRKLPLMFQELGLQDIKVDIDFNRAMFTVGAMDSERLENLESMLLLAQPKFAAALAAWMRPKLWSVTCLPTWPIPKPVRRIPSISSEDRCRITLIQREAG
jgi:hypothetical protein